MKKLIPLFVLAICFISIVSCISKEMPVTETYYETEYKTEYKTETYTETEDVVVHTSEDQTYLTPVSTWQTNLYFKAGGSGTGITYYYGYEIDTEHTTSQVKILVSSAAGGYIGVYNLTGVGQIPAKQSYGAGILKAGGEPSLYPGEQEWLDNLNTILTDPKRILFFQSMSALSGNEIIFDSKGIKEFAIFANSWNQRAIQSVKLAWSDDTIEKRTATKERQVPYEMPYQVEKQRTVMQTKQVPFWEAIFQ
jgi:hypothetical protein